MTVRVGVREPIEGENVSQLRLKLIVADTDGSVSLVAEEVKPELYPPSGLWYAHLRPRRE